MAETADYTALMYASFNGQPKIVKALLAADAGTEVNAKDNYGTTALHFAIKKDNDEVVRALLGAGADINARTRNGKRALTYAINWEREEIAAIMTEQGALE